jgi:hypothetical protein
MVYHRCAYNKFEPEDHLEAFRKEAAADLMLFLSPVYSMISCSLKSFSIRMTAEVKATL